MQPPATNQYLILVIQTTVHLHLALTGLALEDLTVRISLSFFFTSAVPKFQQQGTLLLLCGHGSKL